MTPQTEYQTAYVIEQLESLKEYENENLSYRELVNKLARKRAMEVEVQSPHSSWF